MKLETALHDLNEGETKAPKIASDAIGSDKVISPLEYERLIHGARSERQRCFLLFLWVTGCRVSEMLNVKLANCEVGERVRIRILGKGRKERFVSIPYDLYMRIDRTFVGVEYLFETKTGATYSRSYVSNQIAKLGRDIISKRISAHTFRHSFATRKISETHKTEAVSRYLGHSSVAITLSLYVHEQFDDADLDTETDRIGF